MAEGRLFARLKATCPAAWEDYVRHPFVRGLGDGTLPEAAFRYYLGQDYLFLMHFARAYALALYKSDTLEDMRQAAGGVAAILDTEIGLHVGYCAGWGLDEASMAALPEDPGCMAYTRFVLVDDAGDLLNQGSPTGVLPPLRERRQNFQVVAGSKYAVQAELVGKEDEAS